MHHARRNNSMVSCNETSYITSSAIHVYSKQCKDWFVLPQEGSSWNNTNKTLTCLHAWMLLLSKTPRGNVFSTYLTRHVSSTLGGMLHLKDDAMTAHHCCRHLPTRTLTSERRSRPTRNDVPAYIEQSQPPSASTTWKIE